MLVILSTLLAFSTVGVGYASGNGSENIPTMINYQGYLTDSSGNPINGTLSIRFSIYSTASGGSPLWQETQSSVTITDGLFNVLLGSVNSITAEYLTGTSYLGVKVGTDAEMTPRQRIVSSAYSLRSDSSNSAEQLVKDFVVASGENVTAGDVVAFHDGFVRKGYIATSNSTPYLANQGQDTNYLTMAKLTDNKFVMAYSDGANNSYGTAVIGEITGNVISLGQEYIFKASNVRDLSVVALSDNKFVIAFGIYRNAYTDGAAIVGTVLGDNITFGSEYIFSVGHTNYYTYGISGAGLSESSFVVSFDDPNNQLYGTAVVGEISGTDNITYGSKYVFNPETSTDIGKTSRLSATKFMIAFKDSNNSGTAIIGNISGSVITYGSGYVFNSNETSYITAKALTEDKFIISYEDEGTNGNVIIGDVTGDNITYGSEYPFASNPNDIYLDSLSATTSVLAWTTNNYNQRNVTLILSISGTTITFGEEGVYTTSHNANERGITTLSPSKFAITYEEDDSLYSIIGEVLSGTTQEFPPHTLIIGIAKESGSAGETVTVITGGVSDIHSGLNAGTVYYADLSGALTAVSNYNRIGLALSSTEILIYEGELDSIRNNQYFGDMIFANDFRITEASTYDGLILKNQTGQEIMSIDENGNLTTAGTLETQGSPTFIRRVTQSYVIGEDGSVITCDASLSSFIVTLPASSTVAGRQFTIKKTDATSNEIIVITAGAETIDGINEYLLDQPWKYITVVSDGLNWLIIANN